MNALSRIPAPSLAATLTAAVGIALADVIAKLNNEFPPDAAPATEPVADATSNVVAVDFAAARETAETVEPDAPPLPDEASSPIAEAEPEADTSPAPVVTTRELRTTVDRAALARATAIALGTIDKRNTIPILSNVLVKAEGGRLTIEGTNLDQVNRVTIPCNGDDFAVTVQAHVLAAVAAHRKAGELAIIATETIITRGENVAATIPMVRLVAGRSEFNLQTLPVSDYPDLAVGDFPTAFTIPADTLCDALRDVSFAISTEETRYYLNGIYLHVVTVDGAPVLRAVATDGHRLARIDVPAKSGHPVAPWSAMPGVIIPRAFVATVLSLFGKKAKAKKGEVAYAPTALFEVSETKVRMTVGDVQITSKLIDGTFPDYCRVIPQGNDKVLRIDGDALADAIECVSIISSQRGKAVRFSLAADSLAVMVNNPDTGASRETVACEYASDEMDIGFNSDYLADILARVMPAGKRTEPFMVTFRLADAGSPALIESGFGPTCVLMPMRV